MYKRQDLYTGLRIGELCALSWPDFSPDRDYFDISFILERLSKKWVKDHSEYTQVPIIGAKSDASTAVSYTHLQPQSSKYSQEGRPALPATTYCEKPPKRFDP